MLPEMAWGNVWGNSTSKMTEQRERIFYRADQSTWPEHVHMITFDDLDGLGIDDERQLYWHGKPIEVRKRLQLTAAERWFAIVGVLAAVVVAVAAVVNVYPTQFAH